jgi:Ca2+-binding EF-hand superfamily protein
MNYKTKYLLASTAMAACFLSAAPSYSDTVVHETVTESSGGTVVKKTVTTEQPVVTTVKTEITTPGEERIISGRGERTLTFADFDMNHNGILSMNEVGIKMFRIYDLDGNGVIDSNEYKENTIVTLTPTEKTTITSYTIEDEESGDKTTYTRESFMEESRLTRFGTVKKGLSPSEFVGRAFNLVDVNRDHAIDVKEWQGTYIASIDKKNKINAETNK